MTPQLRGESAYATAHSLFSKVSYLRADAELEPDFRAKAALLLSSAVFCAEEQIPCDALTIVVKGVVAINLVMKLVIRLVVGRPHIDNGIRRCTWGIRHGWADLRTVHRPPSTATARAPPKRA